VAKEHLKAYVPVQLDVELLRTLEALAQLTGLSRADYLQDCWSTRCSTRRF
jgi:hypothetical protein